MKHLPSQKTLWWRRRGLLNLWFYLTAPPRPTDLSTLSTREYVRRSEVTSLTMLAVTLFTILLTSNALSDPSTALAVSLTILTVMVAALINRSGHVTIAAYILVCMMMLVIAISIVEAKGGLRLIWFTTYDLFAIPVFYSSLIIHRNAALISAFIAATFIVLDYTVHPHAHITSALGAHNFDELAYEVSQPFFNWWALINRNVLLILFAGFFGWLFAYSFEKALLWAEQAKGEVEVANALVAYKESTAQALAVFLNELVTAFVAQANGEDMRLQPRPVGDPFHYASLLLNEQLRRFEQLRRQQNIWSSSQTATGLRMLSGLLNEVLQGHMPIQVLADFHTGIEMVDQLADQMLSLLQLSYNSKATSA